LRIQAEWEKIAFMKITFRNHRTETINIETYLSDSGARASGGGIKPGGKWVTDDGGQTLLWVWGVEVPNASRKKDFPCKATGGLVVIDDTSETNKCRWKPGH
jgi:hypothetical protein